LPNLGFGQVEIGRRGADHVQVVAQVHVSDDAPRAFCDLLEAAAGGDDPSFEVLVGPLLPRLRGYMRAQAGDDGEDLVGDVLLRVFRGLGGFSGGESELRSWVFTIAHHRLVDHRRRRPHDEPLDSAAAARICGGDAEQDAMDSLVESDLWQVLALLSPAQRQALLLRVVAGLSVDETAAVMGKKPGAVRVLQQRALESVRKKIRRGV